MQRKEVECWAQKCEHLNVSLKSLRIPKEVPASGSLKQKDNLESWTAGAFIQMVGHLPAASSCSLMLIAGFCMLPAVGVSYMLGLPAFVLLRVI